MHRLSIDQICDNMATKPGSGARLQRLISGFIVLLIALFSVCLLRTLLLAHRKIEGPPCKPEDVDFVAADEQVVDRFRHAIRIQTVSVNPGEYNRKELLEIQQFIRKAYPTIHSSPLVKHEVIANYSLLYEVKGSDARLTPYLLMGHLDVVPVQDQVWDVQPFSSEIRDGFIYGRGTLDDKHTVFGILEACEFMLRSGRKPRRTFFMAFGHDEEVGGFDGAKSTAKVLSDRGLEFEFILDEGSTILNGVIPSMDKPVAMVSVTEKGRMGLRLTVNVQGGHSSMPPPESSIGILSTAVSRLEGHRHPSQFGNGPERAMFEHLAPDLPFPARFLMSNLWLFSPLISWYISRKPEGNAMSRTTTAVTIFNAGTKENVLASQATAIINHRVHPTQTLQDVVDFDKYVINDERVEVEVMHAAESHPLSSYGDEDFGYQTIKSSILQVWGYTGAVVVPGILVGNTDTRHFIHLSKNIYRFSPTYMYPEDLARFHGRNERLSVKNYEEAVNFFYHVIANADKPELEPLHRHGEEL